MGASEAKAFQEFYIYFPLTQTNSRTRWRRAVNVELCDPLNLSKFDILARIFCQLGVGKSERP